MRRHVIVAAADVRQPVFSSCASMLLFNGTIEVGEKVDLDKIALSG